MIKTQPSKEQLAEHIAAELVTLARACVAERGRFTLVLSGGGTPQRLFELMADLPLPWSQVHLFWGDERCVPPDQAGSNFKQAYDAFIAAVPIPAVNVHRMRGELSSQDGAIDYANQLDAFESPFPKFDLVLLGMGSDGHTASLFPGSRVSDGITQAVVADYGGRPANRITVTERVINAARNVWFLVTGAGKAAMVERVINGERDEVNLPAQRIRPTNGDLTWWLDETAAGALTVTPTSERQTTIVIYGASGDLTYRKLVPGLYTLFCKGDLPEKFNILGFSRRDLGTDGFRAKMREGIETFARADLTEEKWAEFSAHLHYLSGQSSEKEGNEKLRHTLAALEGDVPVDRLYYLSVPPSVFDEIAHSLDRCGLLDESEGYRRVIVEKPFGYDLASAKVLNSQLLDVLDESQIYRIDHYLAKETVQNLLVFRFGNTIFEPVWNRNYIESVQITAAESVDVGRRASYYDGSGVLRDMFQNHLLQMMSLVAMEPPSSFEANAIRNEKVKVLGSVRPADIANDTVRARYAGYADVDGVAADSQTPTFAALRLFIDNWRWQGVPFYLRSGKALKKKTTEITIQFKKPPYNIFSGHTDESMRSNILSICVQPDEGMHLRMEAKVPDTSAEMHPVDFEFHYGDTFGKDAIPEAYERLLLEALAGDASLFTRGDSIELAWHIIDPILAGWQGENAPPLGEYAPGSWGPDTAEALVATMGHEWLLGCSGHD